jgi:DeoR/GlpR family transcriptional regulator of sugar metabolism
LAELLQRHRYLGIADLCKEFGVSGATVRRDLAFLEKNRQLTRTYGGALADYNHRFPSFRQRRAVGADGKHAIARQALGLLRPELTVYLDAGTTIFVLAEMLRESPIRPLTCVTSNLPAADMLAEVEGLSVHLLGGQVLRRQSVLLGDEACLSAGFWKFDLALLGAEGMTRAGIWNSSMAVVALQRAVIAQAKCAVVLLDRTKLGRTAVQFLGGWEMVTGLLTDASAEAIEAEGISKDMTDFEHIASHMPTAAAQEAIRVEAEKLEEERKENEKTDLTMPVSLL